MIYLLFVTLTCVWIAQAGNLEPPGPPAPTMKPLTALPASWHDLILLPTRFELVMNGAAVLDHETGLVWQKSPLNDTGGDWRTAVHFCYHLVVEDRKGWRLPVIEELSTLVDQSAAAAPYLPPAHPFSDVADLPGFSYWSITNSAYDESNALTIEFSSGAMGELSKRSALSGGLVWCVRGGIGHNPDPAP